jgi:putative transposase
MKKVRHSESEIFKTLNAAESGLKVYGISSATFYAWRSKYGGMALTMIKRLKELENKNRRLKKMYAEVSMDKKVVQEIIEEKAIGPEEKRQLILRLKRTKIIQYAELVNYSNLTEEHSNTG